MSGMLNKRNMLICTLIVVSGSMRFLPLPPNLTPIIAIAVLSVTYFQSSVIRFGLPLIIMFITDFFLGFHVLMPVVYGSICVAGCAGFILRKKRSFIHVMGAGMLASLLFFLVSNLGVWLLMDMYDKTFSGLMYCYTLAIPFFHNTFAATTSVIFGVMLLEKTLGMLPFFSVKKNGAQVTV